MTEKTREQACHDKYDTVDMVKVLEKQFASGDGVIMIAPDMTDAGIATIIKAACGWSNGKGFRVVVPPKVTDTDIQDTQAAS